MAVVWSDHQIAQSALHLPAQAQFLATSHQQTSNMHASVKSKSTTQVRVTTTRAPLDQLQIMFRDNAERMTLVQVTFNNSLWELLCRVIVAVGSVTHG